jgi:type IV secretion system protein VirB4
VSNALARFLPQVGHYTANIGVNGDGSVFAIYHTAGYPAELAGEGATQGLKFSANHLARNLSDPRIEIWDHTVRRAGRSMTKLPAARSWFANRFDDLYTAAHGGALYRNDNFVTVVMHSREGFAAALSSVTSTGLSAFPQPDLALLEDFRDLLARLEGGLARIGARRLGLRQHGEVIYSEIFEALHLIANGFFEPVALTETEWGGRMGRLIAPHRIIFGDRKPGTWEVMAEDAAHFGAALAALEYPARTWPMMFADLLSAPYAYTLTNSWRFRRKSKALTFLGLRVKQMQSGNDAAKSQIAELVQDEDDVMSGRSVYGDHALMLAIRAPTIEQLDRDASKATSLLSDAGVKVVRETTAIKAAFFSQVPGAMRWRPRPAPIKSMNWVSLAPRHGVLAGRERGRWGAPILMLRTTADTEYHFHFQVQGSAQIPAEDLGNCLLIGPAGSGKTSLLASVCLGALRVPGCRVVVVDKDCGLGAMVRAAGGNYFVLPSGEPSGLNPLQALSDSPADLEFLHGFIANLIRSGGGRRLSDAEDERLRVAIAQQMQMPPEMRSLAGVAVMLGQRDPEGASAGLRKWCRGRRLGWAFDSELGDRLDMSRRMTGFDTTALLKNLEVCAPTLSYLFYRTRQLINGQPIVLAVDEFWQTERVEAFREENNDHLKTIRKNEGVVILATQSARDALKSPNAHTYQQQVPTKIFFADGDASYPDLVGVPDQTAPHFGLTEAEYEAVTQRLLSMRHTFLLKRPSGSVLCRFDLGSMRGPLSALSGRRKTFDLSTDLIAQHGEDPRAWVPEYERIAPDLADDPILDVAEAAE